MAMNESNLLPCPICKHVADYAEQNPRFCCCQNPSCEIFAILIPVKKWNTHTPSPSACKASPSGCKSESGEKESGL